MKRSRRRYYTSLKSQLTNLFISDKNDFKISIDKENQIECLGRVEALAKLSHP